jgi:hypothetical protein
MSITILEGGTDSITIQEGATDSINVTEGNETLQVSEVVNQYQGLSMTNGKLVSPYDANTYIQFVSPTGIIVVANGQQVMNAQ